MSTVSYVWAGSSTRTSSTTTSFIRVWSAPALCEYNPQSARWQVGVASTGVSTFHVNAVATSCLPTPFNYESSPAICPPNWTPGPTNVQSEQTTVICCPTGTALDIEDLYCTATITSPILLYQGTSRGLQDFGAASPLAPLTRLTSGVIRNPYVITVTFESSDLPFFQPASYVQPFLAAVTAPPPTTIPSSIPSTATTSEPSATPTDSANGLSTGAKAGIGIGAAVGGLLVIAALGFLLLQWRRSKRVADRRDTRELQN